MSSADSSSPASRGRGPSDEKRAGAVLRVLAGADPIDTARERGVGVDVLEEWIRVFVQAGKEGLREADRPMGDVERLRAWSKIGELTMRVDLLRRFIARKGYAEELEALESRPPSSPTGRTS